MPRDGDGARAALAEATARLYAAPPEDFVGTRTQLVAALKAAGDGETAKEVGRLRRPTTAAWALNGTVREHPEQAERLGEVGRALREAQGRLDAARLRDLRATREELLDGFLAAATSVAQRSGRALAPAVLDEVRATLIAALASEDATEAVRSGTLTRALAYYGFGEVDLSEAVARTSSGAVLTVVRSGGSQAGTTPSPATEEDELPRAAQGDGTSPREGKAARATKAGRAAEDARAAEAREEEARTAEAARQAEAARAAGALLREAGAALETAEQAASAARQRAREAREHVHEVEAALAQARAEHRAAEEAATVAVRERTAALAARHTAERALAEVQRRN